MAADQARTSLTGSANDPWIALFQFNQIKEDKMRFLKIILLSLFSSFVGLTDAAEHSGPGQMGNSGMMSGSMMQGGMMGGQMMVACMLFALLVFIVLVLAIVALIKYLRS